MTMEPYAHVFPVNSAEIRFLKGSIPMGFLTKLFGTNMAKEIKRLDPIVRKIEALEEEYKGYTDAQLQAKTPELKERYKNGETLDDLLVEAFGEIGRHSRTAVGVSALPLNVAVEISMVVEVRD